MTMTHQDKKRNQPARMIRVLIVDDHPLIREGLGSALKLADDIHVIGFCQDGETALRVMRRDEPNVVLLDINLPGINGLQVARQIRNERLPISIVMLTVHDETQQVVHALRAGAMAYCNKDIDPEVLISVIRDVIRGYHVVDNKRLGERELELWINEQIQSMAGVNGAYMVDPDEHYIPLSARETEILQFVTDGLSNKEIAMQLGISQQTVKNHMTSILNKLNVKDRTQAAVTALKHGWVRNTRA
jgi:DNA-binding NarL/FixJ family response regulator